AVVWFENEILAIFSNKRQEVDLLSAIEGLAIQHVTRPGNVRLNGFDFGGVKQSVVGLIAQKCKAALFVKQKRLKIICDRNILVGQCLEDGAFLAHTLIKLAAKHAFVNQIDPEITCIQPIVAVLKIARVG